MKVLVTGSNGFIGGWVGRALSGAGHEVIGLDREPPVAAGLFKAYTCDLLEAGKLASLLAEAQPEAIIHLAARTDLDEKRDLRGYAANTDGVSNLIAAVRRTRCVRRVVYTSSQLVCAIGHVPTGMDDYCPGTLYGESKVLTERIVKQSDGGGVDWCLVRPTTVWGPGMNTHYQGMLRLIRRGLYFHCGNGRLLKSYGYAGNIAHQFLNLLTAPVERMRGRTFYLADYEPISLRDYTNDLAREIGAPRIPSLPLPFARALARLGDMAGAIFPVSVPFNSFRLKNILAEYVYDLGETRAVCGPLPFGYREGVTATAEWFKKVAGPRGA
jgi:nucleoside-diphosphate-sugar epimerase